MTIFKNKIEENSSDYESSFIDNNRPYIAIVCNDSGLYYCKALDEQPKPFSCVLDRGFYEFDSEDKVIEFLQENLELIK